MPANGEDKIIPTTTCPECNREWPDSSEQAVVADLIGKCYACFIQEVVKLRDERVAAADYEIENCPSCTGLPGAREKCIPCGARGWQRRVGDGIIQLVQ
jgi:hypothetical protein